VGRRSLSLQFEPAVATSWELLIDGPSFFPHLLADIEAAQSDVHIIIFGFKPGEIGNRFRDLLIKKVGEGVGVRLIVEGAYSQPALGSKDFYRTLREGGVQIVVNQGGFLDLDGLLGSRRIDWRFDDLGHFDHRKAVVIDGRIGYVGGPGIEDHYADERFHDVMLRLEGSVTAQLQAIFLLSWAFQGGPLPDGPGALDRFFPELGQGEGVGVELLLNNPGEHHWPISDAFREAIAGANRRLYIVNPYLADHGIIKGIIDAGRRGLDVRVIVPANPGSMPARAAIRHWFRALREAGCDVREHPHMAHAKVVLADDTVLIGSANLDALSLRRNWELQVRVHDAAIAEAVARDLFDRDVVISAPGEMPSSRKDSVINAAMAALAPVL
jgi:cardiolipin synthase